MSKRTEMALPVPTKFFLHWAQMWPCCLHSLDALTHLSLSRPFCWSRTYLQRTFPGSDIMKLKVSWWKYISLLALKS